MTSDQFDPKTERLYSRLVEDLRRDFARPEVGDHISAFLLDMWRLRQRCNRFLYQGHPTSDGWFRFDVDIDDTHHLFHASPASVVAVAAALHHIASGDFDRYL